MSPTDPSRPRRSVLFLPASNPRAIAKAASLPCDVVVLDLEDAVAPDAKAEARLAAVEAVRGAAFGPREVVVRVNGLATPWGPADLGALAGAGVDAILAPKVSAAEDVAGYRRLLGGTIPLWAMIETCQAVMALDAIGAASAAHGVAVWLLGANDLAKEMRCRPDAQRTPLLPALTLAIAAARAHGIEAIDAVFNDIGDPQGLERECAQGAMLGFDGKSLIHPSQIEAANRAFAPEAEGLAWAQTIVEAFDSPENAGKGVIKVEGRMVERLHLEEARRLLGLAASIAARETAVA